MEQIKKNGAMKQIKKSEQYNRWKRWNNGTNKKDEIMEQIKKMK